ncbi:hypothetical protein SAMN02745126_05948 [Enhydrobacter aerosaccus]|uniref:Uncharacterized protein n=1 Tax=Enhydrobacter aerosaccus TaxID=225324 RepID=A0A1T4TBF5_9HYPH|nr:hypothetical protein SAMN02745126_05948 [Enhydrobacter aerosaccus]
MLSRAPLFIDDRNRRSNIVELIVVAMGIFSSPSAPYVPPLPAPPPSPPTTADPAVSQAAADAMSRAKAASGFGSTIATTPQGVLGAANTSLKTLLGQ